MVAAGAGEALGVEARRGGAAVEEKEALREAAITKLEAAQKALEKISQERGVRPATRHHLTRWPSPRRQQEQAQQQQQQQPRRQ